MWVEGLPWLSLSPSRFILKRDLFEDSQFKIMTTIHSSKERNRFWFSHIFFLLTSIPNESVRCVRKFDRCVSRFLLSPSQPSSCILAAAVLDLDMSCRHPASLPPPIAHNGIDLPLTPTSFQERERKSCLCLSPLSVSVYPSSVSVYLFPFYFPI